MSDQIRPVVFYHADCVDGFTAAWVCRQQNLMAECIPVRYGDTPPAVTPDTWLAIVDFSFPRDVMLRLREQVYEMVVLDHHKTAQANCDGLPFCQFDMARSGAGLTWDYFFPDVPRPWLVNYVEDRDLWRFALSESKEVNALIRSTEQTFTAWDALRAMPLMEAAERGRGCLAHINAYVRAAVGHAFPARLGEQHLPLVNITYESCSEVADALCAQGHPVAGYWFERGDGKIQYGLRSRGDFDCSVLAEQYGGGGHRGAAGFVVERPVHLRLAETEGQ